MDIWSVVLIVYACNVFPWCSNNKLFYSLTSLRRSTDHPFRFPPRHLPGKDERFKRPLLWASSNSWSRENGTSEFSMTETQRKRRWSRRINQVSAEYSFLSTISHSGDRYSMGEWLVSRVGWFGNSHFPDIGRHVTCFYSLSADLSVCPNNCNEHGDCVDGVCKCFAKYQGKECAEGQCWDTILIPICCWIFLAHNLTTF